MRRFLALWAVAACGLVPGTGPGRAAWAASAEIGKAPPLQIQGKRDLQFGDLLPGVELTLTYLDANAGYWHVAGDKNLEVQLLFVGLPTELDGGADRLPVAFASDAAGFAFQKHVAAATPFDPNVGTTVRLDNTGQLHVWIGGTARPKSTQNPGSYLAPITLEVFYTGN